MRQQNTASPALVWLLCGIVLLSGCAHKKAYKQALAYEKSGRYVEAARKDLEALDKKPGFDEPLAHLRKIAPFAYQELLGQAETLEGNAQWIEAAQNYGELQALLQRFLRHNVVLQTIDVPGRTAQAREKGAAYHYETAERHFAGAEYEPAIAQYKKVATLAGYHRDTKEKLWQAHTRLGDRELQAQQFQPAIGNYEQALNYAADMVTAKQLIATAYHRWADRDLQAQQFQSAIGSYERALNYAADIAAAKRLIADAYYRWAEQLEANKDFREAMAKFEQAHAAVPDYKNAAKRAQAAYDKAVRRVAILPFRNRTSYNNQYGYLLTEELLGECINANLKFAVFINRENLDQIFEEYKLSQSGAVDERKAVEIGKLEGIHSFVTGTITQISVETASPKFEEKAHEKVYSVKDSTGKPVEKREPIYYREYTAKRTVQISASYQIVDVETGRYLSGENLSENSVDEAKWVRYQGSIYDLPENKRKLLDASGEPKAADLMINDLVRVVGGKMSEKVLRFYQ